jgi:cytidylate kinase
MYRAITFAVLDAGHAPDDAEAALAVAQRAAIEVENGVTRVDGRDVSREIRGPDVTAAVSAVSAHPRVREVLVAQQRAWVDEHDGGVVEGRDIGTVVFPDAAVKVFLSADDAERARRRQQDEAAANRSVDVAAVQDALARRDALDSSRKVSPLRPADDAVVIDTTNRSVADITAEIVSRFRAAG